MSEIRIITDNKWRTFLYGHELTEKERKEFDYIPADEIDEHTFFRYLGWCYDLAEFVRVGNMPNDNPLSKWHGCIADTFFSGVVIRVSANCDQYQVGRYYQ